MSELRRRLALLLERLSPRERLLLGGAVALTVVILIWLVGNVLAERRALLATRIAAAERDLAEMVGLRERHARLRAERDAVRARLAGGGADFSLFSHLEGVARDVVSRDRIAAINPSTRTVTADLHAEDVELRLAGVPLRDLVTLLHRVEKSELPLTVSRLQLKKRFDEPALFDATLVVERLRPARGGPPR